MSCMLSPQVESKVAALDYIIIIIIIYSIEFIISILKHDWKMLTWSKNELLKVVFTFLLVAKPLNESTITSVSHLSNTLYTPRVGFLPDLPLCELWRYMVAVSPEAWTMLLCIKSPWSTDCSFLLHLTVQGRSNCQINKQICGREQIIERKWTND